MKQSYQRPSLTEWGTVSDLTQGTGQTESTDDFTCVIGMMDVIGSTGSCPPGQG